MAHLCVQLQDLQLLIPWDDFESETMPTEHDMHGHHVDQTTFDRIRLAVLGMFAGMRIHPTEVCDLIHQFRTVSCAGSSSRIQQTDVLGNGWEQDVPSAFRRLHSAREQRRGKQ